MRRALALALVTLAARWTRDRCWGVAMLGELEAAETDGYGLPFAWGCLWGALKGLPHHPRGRALLVRFATALVIAAPFALFELGCAWRGAVFVALGQDHYYSYLMAGDESQQAQALAYRMAAPLFTFLLAAIGICQAKLTWQMLTDRWKQRDGALQGALLASLCMAAIILALDVGFAALLVYPGIPCLQWCVMQWLRSHFVSPGDGCMHL